MRTLAGLAALCTLLLLVGAGTVLVADSPYDRNVVSERKPFAPERPATLDRSNATAYLVEYEQTRLRNDLLGSRGYTIDRGDEIRADCAAVSVTRTDSDAFRVRLRCRGDIDDTLRLFGPSGFSYTVTYRITDRTRTELDVSGYPFSDRDELRPRPDWDRLAPA